MWVFSQEPYLYDSGSKAFPHIAEADITIEGSAHIYAPIKREIGALYNINSNTGGYKLIDHLWVMVVMYKEGGKVHSWKVYEGYGFHDDSMKMNTLAIRRFGDKLSSSEAKALVDSLGIIMGGFYD